jgi:Uma2 family endonuclease
MTAIATAPLSAETLKCLFDESDFITVPATEAEFWRLIELPKYHIEYHYKQIVGTMSYAATNHERIVSNLIFALRSLLDEDNYETFGSNRPIYAAECRNIYEPDVHVIEGQLVEYHYDKTKTASRNPAVIVEVFSPTTKNFDLTQKLDCYKMMPSLKHIIYIEQDTAHIHVYNRTKDGSEWEKTEYFDLKQTIRVLGKSFSLAHIYKKVIMKI